MICDKCKTEVSSAAKFCPKCGSKVEEVHPAVAQDSAEGAASAGAAIKQASPTPNAEGRTIQPPVATGGGKSSKGPLIAVIVALLVLVGAGAYLYFTGFAGKDPAKLGAQISDELKAKGLNLYCEVDKNWTATLKGSVKSPADKEIAMGIVKAHKEVKDVKDELQPQLSPSDVKLAVDNALSGAGFMDIHAEVDENFIATLKGTALSESEKDIAVNTARAVEKVKDVKDNIQVEAAPPPAETESQSPLPAEQPKQTRRAGSETGRRHPPESAILDPFELEVKINRALQKDGLRKVRARVGERFGVFLSGRVDSEDDKARAIEIAGSFNGIRKVRDKIVVAGN